MITSLTTLSDLKTFINSLTDEQLQQPLRYWGEADSGIIEDVMIADEDYIDTHTGDGAVPLSIEMDDADDDYREELEDETRVLYKGDIIFGLSNGQHWMTNAEQLEAHPLRQSPPTI